MSELTSQEVWSKCLNVIKDNVSPLNFKTWFKSCYSSFVGAFGVGFGRCWLLLPRGT